MKNLALLSILFVLFAGVAKAGVITKKYCSRHQRNFNPKIDYRISKNEISPARGNIIKLVAHNECLKGIEQSLDVSEFKSLFKPVKLEICIETQVGLNSLLFQDINGDDDSMALDALDILEEVDDVCTNYVDDKMSTLEFKLELSNRFGITI